MKRDMALSRTLLLDIETEPEPVIHEFQPVVPNYDQKTILYHVNLLHEEGLIAGDPFEVDQEPLPIEWLNVRLTSAGHDFLDAARDDKIWRKALEKLGSGAASVSFVVLKALLEKIARERLGLS